ncbi:hypothetical protein BDP55DRAFT_628781 [Colletotrichum godetiae]|uniref:Uncharacterized protein n=1 Tax=Colletotrichum godetiae TaxID=1209918 RepID=A0AAJ0AUY7_9PEZI|nr:uncharacterized protein BDP55DRAFT_628781 [Colletotrichum godetiae]KAK1689461.1 hypothetical protein BDP55DRAFT_628781 [Colletotrichum godetiae]
MQGVQEAFAYIVLTTWDHDRVRGHYGLDLNAQEIGIAPELNTGETGCPVVQVPGMHGGAAPPNGVQLVADICSSKTYTSSVQVRCGRCCRGYWTSASDYGSRSRPFCCRCSAPPVEALPDSVTAWRRVTGLWLLKHDGRTNKPQAIPVA